MKGGHDTKTMSAHEVHNTTVPKKREYICWNCTIHGPASYVHVSCDEYRAFLDEYDANRSPLFMVAWDFGPHKTEAWVNQPAEHHIDPIAWFLEPGHFVEEKAFAAHQVRISTNRDPI
jgi:hypothetical protein